MVIGDGRIQSISNATDDANHGLPLYALPGLIDMHVHHPLASGLAAVSGDARLFDILFLSHGVTTVRDTGSMDGKIFEIRRSISSGGSIGPRIFACGAILDGDPPGWPGAKVVRTREEAQRVVDEQADAGADCIKVYDSVSRDALSTIRDEAAKRRLPVIGHLPRAVPFEDAHLADVQHLTGVVKIPSDNPSEGLVTAWTNLPPDRIDFIVRTSVEQHIQHTPTMTVPKNLFRALTTFRSNNYEAQVLADFPE